MNIYNKGEFKLNEGINCLTNPINFEVFFTIKYFLYFDSSDNRLIKMALAADRMKKREQKEPDMVDFFYDSLSKLTL